ncbi:MAG: SgcJ/EcaC family oxidoreductase [Acidobacteriota bacterium]|jgi:uncharacterized protein (TIGR02246 family)
MRRVLGGSVCALILLSLVAAAPAGAQSAEEDVQEMIQRVNEAWAERDAERMGVLFAEDADVHDQDDRWIDGRGEIIEYYEEWFSEVPAASDHEVALERFRPLDDGLLQVDVIGALVPEGGSFWGKGTERYAITTVVRLERDGAWRFQTWRQCTNPK